MELESVEPLKQEVAGDSADGICTVESLLELASCARFFCATDGRFHACLPVNGRYEIVGLKSAALRDWLVNRYLSRHRKLPRQWIVRQAIEALEARARFEVHRPPVHIRVGSGLTNDKSSDYLDLGDPSGQAVQIRESGWTIVERPNTHFKRPHGLLPLPMPVRGGAIELLRPFVNLSEADFSLLVGWMAAALRPVGPYPILVVHGEQGAAKSTLAKVVRQLIDPQTAPLLAEPSSTRDLIVTALNGWLLVYDNVSVLPGWLSDSLCRLATGGGFASRSLFSNDERHVMHVQRPIVLNGIDEFVRRGDLADRAVLLHLPPINSKKRREEREFWRSFEELQPRILGGLLDVIVGALRELPSVQIADLPRMADFARFGEAVSRAMGCPPDTFLSAYLRNRSDASNSSLEDSLLARVLIDFLENEVFDKRRGSPADILDELSSYAGSRIRSSKAWPKTPSKMGNELRRIAPHLRERGFDIEFERTSRGRFIELRILYEPVDTRELAADG
jgi:hypothetical protein